MGLKLTSMRYEGSAPTKGTYRQGTAQLGLNAWEPLETLLFKSLGLKRNFYPIFFRPGLEFQGEKRSLSQGTKTMKDCYCLVSARLNLSIFSPPLKIVRPPQAGGGGGGQRPDRGGEGVGVRSQGGVGGGEEGAGDEDARSEDT